MKGNPADVGCEEMTVKSRTILKDVSSKFSRGPYQVSYLVPFTDFQGRTTMVMFLTNRKQK